MRDTDLLKHEINSD